MVCSHCKAAGHYKSTCPTLYPEIVSPSEKKVAKALMNILKVNEVNLFSELPRGPIYAAKKITKTLEGMAGCQNIFKEPKSFYETKKVNKPLEGLTGCKNIFKEPKSFYETKVKSICGMCGEMGHNKRTCASICMPCADQTCRSICFAGLTATQATDLAKNLDAVNPLN